MEKARDQRRQEINRQAQKMAKYMILGHDAEQPPEFIEAQRGYMWQQHELNESEKFDPPYFGDHRFC